MKTKSTLLHALLISTIMLSINCSVKAAEYFVKPNGTGMGSSWDDALSPEYFIMGLNGVFSDGDIIYVAGGVYKPVSSSDPTYNTFTISKSITIIGGFNPQSTGQNKSITYPSQFETIFSGDINNDNSASTGDVAHIFTINASDKVTMKGLSIKNAYFSGSTSTEGAGAIVVNSGSQLLMEYCKVTDNISEARGGAAITLLGAQVSAYRCLFDNNKSNNRGGAFRIEKNSDGSLGSQLVLDACLLSNNSITGDYGGTIQIGSTTAPLVHKVYIVNSTLANNACGGKGGAGISISAGQEVYILSSTFANNVAGNVSQGCGIRNESEKLFMGNTICVDESANNNFYSKVTFNSSGNNVIGGTTTGTGTGPITWVGTDIVDKTYSDVFGTNVLSANGGFTNTIPLAAGINGTATLEMLTNLKNQWNITADITEDQRGSLRPSVGISPGAFQIGVNTSIENQNKSDDFLVYPTKTNSVINIVNAMGKDVSMYNLVGGKVLSKHVTNTVETIDISTIETGIYLIHVNKKVIKIIKE